MKKWFKKGQKVNTGAMLGLVVFMVAVFILISFTGSILQTNQDTVTTNSLAFNATNSTLAATVNFSEFSTPIALVIAAVVIIGIVMALVAITRNTR